MLQEFINQNYLIIESNVVTNLCIWNGDTTVWTPPAGSIALIQETTPAMVWEINADKNEYVLTERLGAGAIGFIWDGITCVTNEPQPEPPKPQLVTTGVQTA